MLIIIKNKISNKCYFYVNITTTYNLYKINHKYLKINSM